MQGGPDLTRSARLSAGRSLMRFANPLAPRRALPEKLHEIKTWVREAYRLGDEVVVSVTELACREENCPDIETVIGIMRTGLPIETVRVHKSLVEVQREDIP